MEKGWVTVDLSRFESSERNKIIEKIKSISAEMYSIRYLHNHFDVFLDIGKLKILDELSVPYVKSGSLIQMKDWQKVNADFNKQFKQDD